jgi:hypothetical protein
LGLEKSAAQLAASSRGDSRNGLPGHRPDVDSQAHHADHLLAEDLAAVPDADHVDPHDLVPLVLGHLERWPMNACAGVVDEHVDPSQFRRDLLGDRHDGPLVTDVGPEGARPDARGGHSSTTVLLAAATRATMATAAPASPSACAKARPRPRLGAQQIPHTHVEDVDPIYGRENKLVKVDDEAMKRGVLHQRAHLLFSDAGGRQWRLNLKN